MPKLFTGVHFPDVRPNSRDNLHKLEIIGIDSNVSTKVKFSANDAMTFSLKIRLIKCFF